MVNSETPACRKAPEKSPLVNAFVCFKKPSVLSEFERSADATTMFSTCCASTPSTEAEAALVAEFGFCSMASQLISGSSRANHFLFFSASSGFSFFHASSFAFLAATIVRSFSFRLLYNSSTSGKITNGFAGSPPKFLMVWSKSAPAALNGCPCVET